MHARSSPTPSPRFVTVLLLLASGAVVGAALLFQYAGGFAPCELCLYERWPYYAVVVVSMIGLSSGNASAMRALVALCGLIFLAGAGLSFYHVGVEQHWFAGPSACTGSAGGADTIEALKAQLMKLQPVKCDEPAWTLFGISLAGFNLLASLLLLAFCLAAWRRLGRRRLR
ncbi:MAG TPA: disulfide bond formation protein B [Stellaceae bacterium]|nr:disulfide bond formation protein B [Stellaceae bacterium]